MQRRHALGLLVLLSSACGGAVVSPAGDTTAADASTGDTGGGSSAGSSTGAPADASTAPIDAGAPPLDGGATCDAGVDLQDDPWNCGTCGHGCAGAACVAGRCTAAPVVLAANQAPTKLALDSQNLYWINALPQPTGTAGHTQLVRLALGGGAVPAVVWDADYAVEDLAVQGGSLLFPTGPGPVSAQPYGAYPVILSCATGGCANMASTLVASTSEFTAFAVGGGEADWATGDGSLWACALSGCGGTAATLYADPHGVRLVARNATSVFWTNYQGDVSQCPSTGCAAAVAVLVPGLLGPAALVADEQRVYFVSDGAQVGGGKAPIERWTSGSVAFCPLAGCPGGPAILATYDTWLGAGAIAADATDVYWSTEDASGAYGLIVRCAIGGCGGKPTPIGATHTTPASFGSEATPGLAVDATHVYWSDPDGDTVMMLSK